MNKTEITPAGQMNTVLYLCEKPAQARHLAKVVGANKKESGAFVGENVIVTYCYGSMQNLADADEYIGHSEWRLADLPILPKQWLWKVGSRQREQFDNIGLWLNKADSAVIATDPDDAGEVIGRQVLHAHGFTKPIQRLWSSALDTRSLDYALQNLLPLTATDSHYHAGMIRNELDWLLGVNLTRAFSIQLGCTAHIGRVKTQLLNLVVSKESVISDFIPNEFSKLSANIADCHFVSNDFLTSNAAINGQGVCVSSVEEQIEISPPLPFTLSALLVHANETAGISLANGYAAAQTLYEGGAISYPRTSSSARPFQGSIEFAAHHAIMTTQEGCPKWADGDTRSIFLMIQQNGLFQQLGKAHFTKKTTIFDFGGQLLTNVTHTGNHDAAGWMLFAPKKLNELISPSKGTFYAGQKVMVIPTLHKQNTKSPERYSEGDLLKAMMDHNIGTEATRVEAILNLIRDGVAVSENNKLRATKAGIDLHKQLPSELSSEMNSIVMTATELARKNSSCESSQLLSATKWLAKIIHGEKEVCYADD